jgi:hypothetical protein
MAQHDYDLANGTGAAFRADANAALAAVLTLNSGASEPSTRQAYMLWADTSAGLLKIRNAANNAWITVGTLSSTNLGLVPNSGGSQANALGSAGAPSYSFSGDTNTGFYSSGADIVACATSGALRWLTTAQGYFKASDNGSYGGTTSTEHEFNQSAAGFPILRLTASNASYTNNAIQIYAARNTTNGTYKVIDYFNTGSSNARFAVFDSGAILSVGSYNNTTASAANLFIDTNGAILRSTSSGDYKTDVEPITDEAANVVLELNPIRYRSLADSDNSAWSFYGLIAEDVAALDPRLCHWGYREDDYEVVETESQRYDEETNQTVTVQVPTKQLKPDAQLRAEGVQYERVGVLTLAMVQRMHARLTRLENRILDLESV